MDPGLYEELVSELLKRRLTEIPSDSLYTEPLQGPRSAPLMARYVARLLEQTLHELPDAERPALVNEILDLLRRHDADLQELRLPSPAELLLEIRRPPPAPPASRPVTPLSMSALLTNARQDPSLLSELKKEMASADRFDILCSFILWSGFQILRPDLEAFAAAGRPLRVLTSAYMGITQPRAVAALAALPGAQVRVSYETGRTRMHAKAYLFHRLSGMSTAYVGSSNLSHSAVTEGLEWNVKLSAAETRHLLDKIRDTFETTWNDPEFEPYEADRLRDALRRATSTPDVPALFPFRIEPRPHQVEILAALDVERDLHRRTRNLVVAATGTGKTVVAAFDFRRFRMSKPRARMLFVAHREEILTQSLACFRGVLGDANFGELLVGGHEPATLDQLFCSIQSFGSKGLADRLGPDFYDYIVVDEFHHAAAPSYRRLLDHFKPAILLGLTATPERSDELSILEWFDNRIAAELRLHAALERQLLCPFHYYGITDPVSLADIPWRRGRYDPAELDRRLGANKERAEAVVRAVREKVADVDVVRGLGFCVSVAHAEFMAAAFTAHGLPSAALTAGSDDETRRLIQRRLEARELRFVFTVDLYNEGVDLPWIDTVLFLRPTESLTVFLQQLGRGLRLHDGKSHLTVLDFIGQADRRFRWDLRLRALTGPTQRTVEEDVELDFPRVPPGCAIVLERVARQHVLDNVRHALTRGRGELVARIRDFEEESGRKLTLVNFLRFHRLEPDDLYRRASWSRLKVEAGCAEPFADPDEVQLTKGFRRLAHIDDVQRIAYYLEGRRDNPRVELMQDFSLWGKGRRGDLQRNPVLQQELRELLEFRAEEVDHHTPDPQLPFPTPLHLHASYTRDELLTGLGYFTAEAQPAQREGVLDLPTLKAHVLFVTLFKEEKDYSPTTMYRDYAMSERLFHWQSQSRTTPRHKHGRLYINQAAEGTSILLFVREHKSLNGLATPYVFLGPVTYQSHEGERPMNVVWRLQHALPARLQAATSTLSS